MRRVAEFTSNHRTSRGENVNLVVGTGFIRIIADQNALEGFRKTLQPEDITEYSKDLTEITVHLPLAAHTTRGIVAKVTTELALNDINLAGIVECAPELTIVVADKDAPRALEALQQMLNKDIPTPGHSSPASSGVRISRTVIHA
jgi:aspartokinase